VTVTLTASPRLLRFELLDLSMPVDLSLLRRHLSLQILFLLLPPIKAPPSNPTAAPMPAPPWPGSTRFQSSERAIARIRHHRLFSISLRCKL
jgi:hypothetical protein